MNKRQASLVAVLNKLDKAGYTQTEMAECIGVHQTTVGNWMKGKPPRVPKEEDVLKLRELLTNGPLSTPI